MLLLGQVTKQKLEKFPNKTNNKKSQTVEKNLKGVKCFINCLALEEAVQDTIMFSFFNQWLKLAMVT